MISFLLCLALLIAGYFIYGRMAERLFGPDDRLTPVRLHPDGVDYIAMPRWRIFMIQFLNIAGTGPIFGAILGAKFGTACFLWIVFGCILIGAVHDYLAAMISLRHDGESLPEIIGRYLGTTAKGVMRGFTILLLILVGAVFVISPATILDNLTSGHIGPYVWMAVIFAYYLLASVLPIDKVIGRIYPIFAIALLFMAAGLCVTFFFHVPASMPELWDGLSNTHPQADTTPLFPMLFITVACGAISGFHATQSPMMCRCMHSERDGRPVFYGAMITEGIVALIWAAAATCLYHTDAATLANSDAPVLVFEITRDWLGPIGAILAILGVVAAPITTGDTALRSCRLIVADMLKLSQARLANRLGLSVVLFAVTALVMVFSLADPNGFNILWRYFAWANQTLAVFTLWAVTVYLARRRTWYVVTLLPAMFMTMVCASFILLSPTGLHLSATMAYTISAALTLAFTLWFAVWNSRQRHADALKD